MVYRESFPGVEYHMISPMDARSVHGCQILYHSRYLGYDCWLLVQFVVTLPINDHVPPFPLSITNSAITPP